MKNFSYSVNVDSNQNYIVSHTESDWSAMRNNSLISIDNDPNFYNVGKTEPLNFITDFTIEGRTAKIQGNFEHYFIKDDVLTVSYKEYELLAIKSFLNNGSGYKVGDILFVTGGELSVNVFDNAKQQTSIQVEEIDSNGGVLKVKVINKGTYIISPNTDSNLSGGHGSNCRVSIEYSVVNNRKMLERQVLSAENKDSFTLIELNDSLPLHVSSGKLSMSKYLSYLTSNYVGNPKRNVKYTVLRDRTPHLGLPLLAKNSQKTEEFFNHTLLVLDKKIKELEDRLLKAGL